MAPGFLTKSVSRTLSMIQWYHNKFCLLVSTWLTASFFRNSEHGYSSCYRIEHTSFPAELRNRALTRRVSKIQTQILKSDSIKRHCWLPVLQSNEEMTVYTQRLKMIMIYFNSNNFKIFFTIFSVLLMKYRDRIQQEIVRGGWHFD